MSLSPLNIVIMAAGCGTRMKSKRPKVLQDLAGHPLLGHVLNTARALNPQKVIVIVGHEANQVRDFVRLYQETHLQMNIECVDQTPQLGTAHALMQALPHLPEDGLTIVLSGDVPLVQTATLFSLIEVQHASHLALLTVELSDPTGYGRIKRDTETNTILGIVEQKDASDDEQLITEIYSGILAAPTKSLRHWLAKINNNNAQKEYYLTDVVHLAKRDDKAITAIKISEESEVMGVNTPQQLAQLERIVQMRLAHQLMAQGVRLRDPYRLDIRGHLICGQDVEIDVGCVFEGQVELSDDVTIGPHCVIRNARIARGTTIEAYTHIHGDASCIDVGEHCAIGPFARLRAGTTLSQDVHIGNFVEIKNSQVGMGSKANHLTYVGDASVGKHVNIGAGAITANYDGANKHRTTLADHVHVGSNCVLVAPVSIGENSTVAAGSTITKNVSANTLAIARGSQSQIANWSRPKKEPKP